MRKSLSDYRVKIKAKLLENKELAELLIDKKLTESEFDADIQYELDKHIYSFAYLPDFSGKAKTYITFELGNKAFDKNGLYKNITLYFYIFTHNSLMFPKSIYGQYTKYLRTDLIDEEIVGMFHNNYDFGVGKMLCISDDYLKVNNDYYGRQILFRVKDLAKDVCF